MLAASQRFPVRTQGQDLNNCHSSLYVIICCRNEQYQEELWRRSIDYLREHLSPEILEKYGGTQTQPETTTEPSPAATQETEHTESTATQETEPTESTATQETEPTESTATQVEPTDTAPNSAGVTLYYWCHIVYCV